MFHLDVNPMALIEPVTFNQFITSLSSALSGFCAAVLLRSRRSPVRRLFSRHRQGRRQVPAIHADGSTAPASSFVPERLHSRLLLDCPVGVAALDHAGRFVYINPKAENLLGFTSSEISGKRVQSLAPVMREELDRLLAAVKQGQLVDRASIQAIRKDGRQIELFLSVAPVGAEWRDGPATFVALFDEERMSRLSSDQSQALERLQRTHTVGRIGNWEIEFLHGDSRGSTPVEVWTWSDEVYRICGLSESRPEPSDAMFFSLVHPDDRDRVRATAERSLAAGEDYICDHRIVLADGSMKYLREHAAIEFEPSGQPRRMLGTVQDMTEFHLLEEQFLQAQRLESIARLAGGVAHDFNNLLTIINGYAELAAGVLKKGDPLYRHISEIRVAGQRAADLTDRLLAFSSKQVISPKLIDLNEALANMTTILRRLIGEDISLRSHLQEKALTVCLDRNQLDQIVLNLAVNARDAMPDGGVLSISTTVVEILEKDVWRYPKLRKGRHVVLAVEDTGCGMTEHVKRNLFQPFFSTKEQGRGTGLGLASVYGIVSQSGGAIQVESELGRGSTFSIYLPFVTADSDLDVGSSPDGSAASGGNEVLLLVEDQHDLLTIESVVLRQQGYHVIEAADGVEAIQKCMQHEGTIDLLLTDVVMPGMTGPELAERIRGLIPGIRTLFCSGYSRDLVASRGVLLEGTNYLSKPFSPDLLARKVREVLDRQKIETP